MGRYSLSKELLAQSIIIDVNSSVANHLLSNYNKSIVSGSLVSEPYYSDAKGIFLEAKAPGFSGIINVEIFPTENIIAVSIYDTDYIFNLANYN